MKETTIFEDDNTKVTTARFIVGAQTYAMKNVASVRAMKSGGPNWAFTAIAGLATCGFLLGQDWILTGLSALVALVAARLKYKYHVVLTTNSGESKALQSRDPAYIDRIVDALNEAMSHG